MTKFWGSFCELSHKFAGSCSKEFIFAPWTLVNSYFRNLDISRGGAVKLDERLGATMP